MSQKNINILLVLIIVILGAVLTFTMIQTKKQNSASIPKTSDNNSSIKEQSVKLDFYVMSQCPYGTQVEDAIAPVMEKMGDLINLNIDYILYSKENYAGQEDAYCIDDLCSMHGVPEVQGNIVQLCVNKIAPEKWMNFIICQNETAAQIPDNWQTCADKLDLNKDDIQTCYTGEKGKNLLAESKKKAETVNAKGSPTIYLNDKKYEGGRSSLDFQKAICATINNQHVVCDNIPACAIDTDCVAGVDKIGQCINPGTSEAKCKYTTPQPINITVLGDSRCITAGCATENVLTQIKQSFKGINEITKLDYDSEEGKAFYKSNKLQMLPAYLFNKDVETAYFYADLKQYLKVRGDYYELAVGANFDPTKEICDNEIDDTGNGTIDCQDADCQNNLLCRQEQEAKLDLFVMSQCPYGTIALDVMPTILETFAGELDFNVNYIATELEPGKFNSLHGQPEVKENIRELCAILHYPENHQYMDYIVCRNQNITSTNWEDCAENASMDLTTMKVCSEGQEGIDLLSENIKLANSIGIGASPSWLTNNKYQFSGLDAQTIQAEICKYNSNLKGCSVDLSNTEIGTVAAGSCN